MFPPRGPAGWEKCHPETSAGTPLSGPAGATARRVSTHRRGGRARDARAPAQAGRGGGRPSRPRKLRRVVSTPEFRKERWFKTGARVERGFKTGVPNRNVEFPLIAMWSPKGGPGRARGAARKAFSPQRGRPGARVRRASAPPRGFPNGGELISKTGVRRRRTVRRPGREMRLIDGRRWRPSMTAEEL